VRLAAEATTHVLFARGFVASWPSSPLATVARDRGRALSRRRDEHGRRSLANGNDDYGRIGIGSDLRYNVTLHTLTNA